MVDALSALQSKWPMASATAQYPYVRAYVSAYGLHLPADFRTDMPSAALPAQGSDNINRRRCTTMIHASPIIAASDVVELKSASRTTATQRQPSGSSHDRAGLPINLIGFIFPSNPPRSRMDHLTVVALCFIVSTSALGIAIARAVFR